MKLRVNTNSKYWYIRVSATTRRVGESVEIDFNNKDYIFRLRYSQQNVLYV